MQVHFEHAGNGRVRQEYCRHDVQPVSRSFCFSRMDGLDFALTSDVKIKLVTCIGLQQFTRPRDITGMVRKRLDFAPGVHVFHRIASFLQRVCQVSKCAMQWACLLKNGEPFCRRIGRFMFLTQLIHGGFARSDQLFQRQSWLTAVCRPPLASRIAPEEHTFTLTDS